MSFFIAVCPECGERYMHLFVGSTLHSGHACPKARQLQELATENARLRAALLAVRALIDPHNPCHDGLREALLDALRPTTPLPQKRGRADG